MFTDELDAKNNPHKLKSVEKIRAQELKPLLANANYLLDIHCTIKPSTPFVYCENTLHHLRLAKCFDAPYIVSPKAKSLPPSLISSTDSYIDRHGGIGLTYEAGWHKKPAPVKIIMASTLQMLKIIGSIGQDAQTAVKINPTQKSTTLIIYQEISPKTTKFRFVKDWKNLDKISAGATLAFDGKKKIRALKSAYIIFPKLDLIINKPACYLATPIK